MYQYNDISTSEEQHPKLWEDMTIREKQQVMRTAVRNGVRTLGDIKERWNMFALGGDKKSRKGTPEQAIQYFMDKGLSRHAAAGLVGNFMRESGLNPAAYYHDKDGGAYGIAQWRGDRRKKLFARYGNHPTFEQELDYVWDELNSTHKSGLTHLKASQTAEEAARNAFGYYEFQAGPEGAVAAMKRWGQDGEGSMKKGIDYALQIMKVPQSPVVSTVLQSPVPPAFMPSNPEAFFSPISTYVQPVVVEEPMQPIVEQAMNYIPKEVERMERQEKLDRLNTVLGLVGSIGGENSYIGSIGRMLGMGEGNQGIWGLAHLMNP